MPHEVRVRIFAGVSLMIGGFLFGALAPVAIAFAWMPTFDQATMERDLAGSMVSLGDIADWGTKTAIVGWTIAALAFGYTYFAWARWFLGGKPRAAARVEA